jgi:hypothetical protein
MPSQPTAIIAMANEQVFTITTCTGAIATGIYAPSSGYTGIIARIPGPGALSAPIVYGMMSIDADILMTSLYGTNMARIKISDQWFFNGIENVMPVGTQMNITLATATGWSANIQQDNIMTGMIDIIVSSSGNDIVNNFAKISWNYLQGGHGPLPSSQAFAMSGIFTVPLNVTEITVYGYGGGAGGDGGDDVIAIEYTGGYGGGGAAANTYTFSVVPLTTYTVTIGNGGAGGLGGASGSNGGDTIFGSLVTFPGGTAEEGGAGAFDDGSGSGPSGDNGSNYGSYTGGSGGTSPTYGGGGGGNAGPGGNGGDGGSGTGDSYNGSNAPANSGAGGGGGAAWYPVGGAGGNGGSGYLVVSWL